MMLALKQDTNQLKKFWSMYALKKEEMTTKVEMITTKVEMITTTMTIMKEVSARNTQNSIGKISLKLDKHAWVSTE